MNRKHFIQTAFSLGTGITLIPRHVLGGKGYIAPSDKVAVAGIGVGGMGYTNMTYLGENASVTALCDVDFNYASHCFKAFPKAKIFLDYREMLEKFKNSFDAVVIATPDNTHAVMALECMQLGKHVYVQKPLTHDIYEARVLRQAAEKYKVVTQMGNQGHSSTSNIELSEWVEAGIIGTVDKIECWTDRPIWPQGLLYPNSPALLPASLSKKGWDLWLGPASFHPFHPSIYHFKWRGWWPFGTGALGDMACHIIDPAFRALKLGYPSSVEAFSSTFYDRDFHAADTPDSCPAASKIVFDFPKRGDLPQVKLIWTDGGIKFDRPEELKEDDPLGWDGGGVLIHGSKGKAMTGCYGHHTTLLPFDKMNNFVKPTPTYRRIEGEDHSGHERNWIEAILKNNPLLASSPFSYAGLLTETILLGNIALRAAKFDGGAKKLYWDGAEMKIANFDLANQYVKREYREGWSLNL